MQINKVQERDAKELSMYKSTGIATVKIGVLMALWKIYELGTPYMQRHVNSKSFGYPYMHYA